MPDTNYAILVKQTGSEVGVVVFRNPGTLPVDANDSNDPNRVLIDHVLDQGANAPLAVATVTAASNATPIVLTCTLDNGTFADGDLVKVQDVGGNLNANGTFFITSVAGSGTSMTLEGSNGSAAWTSGGKVYKLNKAAGFHIALATATAAVLNDKVDFA